MVLNAHSIVCGPAFKYLVGPDCRIKCGIGMQGIHPDAIARQFNAVSSGWVGLPWPRNRPPPGPVPVRF